LIQNRLWREKREASIDKFVEDLRKKAEVKENLDVLAQVKVDLSDLPQEEAEGGAKKAPKKPGSTAGTATP
jgi:hypothetical protein